MRARLDNFGIVLHGPQFPENIGAAARAAKNMGIRRLAVVSPVDCDLTRMLRMATHEAEDLIADMEVYDDLADALAPYQYIVGTTARTGSQRQTLRNPRALARELIPISQENRVALLFGPESRGLANDELRPCHVVVTIPTAEFSSLNLAQAVMVLAYEVFTAGIEPPREFVPRLAHSFELEGMYGHLEQVLSRIGFMNPENPDYWMNVFRRFLGRMGLQARDVKLIRGVCRQMEWALDRARGRAGEADQPAPPSSSSTIR